MSDSFEKEGVVSLVGCQVRSGRDGGSLSKATKVELSPRKFD